MRVEDGMPRMTGPDCTIIFNLINTHTYTHTHTHTRYDRVALSGNVQFNKYPHVSIPTPAHLHAIRRDEIPRRPRGQSRHVPGLWHRLLPPRNNSLAATATRPRPLKATPFASARPSPPSARRIGLLSGMSRGSKGRRGFPRARCRRTLAGPWFPPPPPSLLVFGRRGSFAALCRSGWRVHSDSDFDFDEL